MGSCAAATARGSSWTSDTHRSIRLNKPGRHPQRANACARRTVGVGRGVWERPRRHVFLGPSFRLTVPPRAPKTPCSARDTAWAMSEENVEVVRRAFEAALRQPPDFGTVNELFDPDHVIATRIAAVEGRSLHGAAGFREWLNDMGEAMESWEVKLTSLRDLGDGRVLASGTLHATSKAGVPIEVENWFISTSATARSFAARSTSRTRRPSKLPGCRSRRCRRRTSRLCGRASRLQPARFRHCRSVL
jgi:ketosteroid isomerase-like protein